MVSEYSGMMVQKHKAVVGANAFAHESGIHQDGMLKARETYEIMRPESVGLVRDCDAGLVLGKHSGRKALGTKLAQMGFALPQEQLNEVFKRFKSIADKKKSISDEDILALVNEEVHAPPAIIELLDLQVMCGNVGIPTATVTMKGPDGIARRAAAIGTGPVDAAYKAIASLSPVQCKLLEYKVSSITEGIDALVCTRVVIKADDCELTGDCELPQGGMRPTERRFTGSGADEDIVVSSARAYISALNKAIAYVAARKQISAIRKAVRESMDSMDEADRTAEPEPAPAPTVAKAGRKAAGAKAPATRGRRGSGSSSRELVARAKKAEGSS
jgi:2-isopropylmalate synthase